MYKSPVPRPEAVLHICTPIFVHFTVWAGWWVGGCACGVCVCSSVWLGLCLPLKIILGYLQQEEAYICAVTSPYLKVISVYLYGLAVI